MKPWLKWSLIGGAFLLLAGGGATVAIVLSPNGKKRFAELLPIFKAAAERNGVPVSWVAAIAGWETRGTFNPALVAGIGTADERRGGSFGVMQMSMQTARGLGYGGPDLDLDNVKQSLWQGELPEGSLLDPAVNIEIGARLVAQLAKRFGQFEDVAAAYNSGKPLAAAPKVTQDEYVPGALSWKDKLGPLDSGAVLAGFNGKGTIRWRRA